MYIITKYEADGTSNVLHRFEDADAAIYTIGILIKYNPYKNITYNISKTNSDQDRWSTTQPIDIYPNW